MPAFFPGPGPPPRWRQLTAHNPKLHLVRIDHAVVSLRTIGLGRHTARLVQCAAGTVQVTLGLSETRQGDVAVKQA